MNINDLSYINIIRMRFIIFETFKFNFKVLSVFVTEMWIPWQKRDNLHENINSVKNHESLHSSHTRCDNMSI